MSTLGSSMPGDELLAGLDAEAGDLLRELVVAGPVSDLQVSPVLRAGLPGRIVDAEAIMTALERAGHVDQRRRDLPGEATTMTVLNLCLYSGEGYDGGSPRSVDTGCHAASSTLAVLCCS